jgi:hypothetical protein
MMVIHNAYNGIAVPVRFSSRKPFFDPPAKSTAASGDPEITRLSDELKNRPESRFKAGAKVLTRNVLALGTLLGVLIMGPIGAIALLASKGNIFETPGCLETKRERIEGEISYRQWELANRNHPGDSAASTDSGLPPAGADF